MTLNRLTYFIIALNAGMFAFASGGPYRALVEKEFLDKGFLPDALCNFFATLCVIFIFIALQPRFTIKSINISVFFVTAAFIIFEFLQPRLRMTFDYYDMIASLMAGFVALGITTWGILSTKK
jgi:hypothetical protein